MHPRLKERKGELEELCRRYGVESLDVFGSASRDDFDRASDFDFVVSFRDTGPGYADRYFDFAQSLEQLLGGNVDLVTERSLSNPIFVQAIARDRTTLYAA